MADNANDDRAPNPVDIHVGAQVRLRRKVKGISQEALAKRLKLTFQQVQKYERGSNRISASKLYEIAQALETPVAAFFEGLAEPSQAGGVAEPAAPFINQLMLDSDGNELAGAFTGIRNRRVRKRLILLMKAIAADEASNGDDGDD